MGRTHDEPGAVASFDVAPELVDLSTETAVDRAAQSRTDRDEAA